MSLNSRISKFKDKKIWIIGASSGIGEACARAFIDEGAHVSISARRLDHLLKIKDDYPCAQVLCHPLDVKNTEQINLNYQEIKKHWGKIDLLIYVAGYYEAMRADEFNLSTAKDIFDINVLGPMAACSTTLPDFLKQGAGGIAIVASVAGYSGLPKSLAYGPSKAAMINFCESLYYDLHSKNISVYMINPGFVETAATKNNDFHMPALISSKKASEYILSGIKNGEFDIHFPKQFSLVLKLLRILPYSIYFYLLKKIIKI
jgi:short-subunit dehydrogenase